MSTHRFRDVYSVSAFHFALFSLALRTLKLFSDLTELISELCKSSVHYVFVQAGCSECSICFLENFFRLATG